MNSKWESKVKIQAISDIKYDFTNNEKDKLMALQLQKAQLESELRERNAFKKTSVHH